MSVQLALNFIREIRQEVPELSGLASPAIVGDLATLVTVAEGRGFRCTADELRKAHKLDWNMRWQRLHYEYTARVRDRR